MIPSLHLPLQEPIGIQPYCFQFRYYKLFPVKLLRSRKASMRQINLVITDGWSLSEKPCWKVYSIVTPVFMHFVLPD